MKKKVSKTPFSSDSGSQAKMPPKPVDKYRSLTAPVDDLTQTDSAYEKIHRGSNVGVPGPGRRSMYTESHESLALGPPLVPVSRPHHYDHLPQSLNPNPGKELFPIPAIERSSESLLNEELTPPGTPEEEEPGEFGFQIFCFSTRTHFVDPAFNIGKADKRDEDRFGCLILFVILLADLPALLLQILYLTVNPFRKALIEFHTCNWFIMLGMTIVSVLLKYITGIMRLYPYNIVMIVTKSICFGVMYLTLTPTAEYLYIGNRVRADPRYHSDAQEELYPELYEEYLINEQENYGMPDIIPHHSTYVFLFGIAYAILLRLCFLVGIIWLTPKFGFFDIKYQLITHTATFLMILCMTTMVLNEVVFFDEQNVVWDLAQWIVGPAIGYFFTVRYVYFLESLFTGHICPLRKHEFYYAAAHY